MPMFLKVKLCDQFKYVYVYLLVVTSLIEPWLLGYSGQRIRLQKYNVQKGKLHEVT